MSKRTRRRRWRTVFDRRSRQVGFVELHADGLWHAWVGARYVGNFGHEEAARAFVLRVAGDVDADACRTVGITSTSPITSMAVAVTTGMR